MNTNLNNKHIFTFGVALSLSKWKMSAGQVGKTLFCLGLIFTQNQAIAQRNFSSERELNNYAYSNTNLNEVTNGYVLDWEINYDDKFWKEFYALQQDKSTYNIDHIFTMFSLMEKMDINTSHFEMDSILFPIMRTFYANDGFSAQNIPLYIFDLEVSKLKPEKANLVKTWENDSPYPAFNQYDFEFQNLYATGLFTDTIVQNYIHFYWNDETFISNKNRTVEKVELKINGNNIELEKDTPYDVSGYYDETNALKQITIKVTFTDGEIKTNTQNVFLIKTPVYAQNKAYAEEPIHQIGGQFHPLDPYENTVLQYQIHYGCDDGEQVLDKPFIIFAGYGAYTDRWIINQSGIHDPWPTPFPVLYDQFNLDGLIDELREANYDVIIARFLPPNESIFINSQLIETLINNVNTTKNNNGSYEENIVMAYSLGAVGSKYTLLRMEKNHLVNGGPHHQCKLYISFDGEHGGANIPLGVQHSVEYLKDYHNSLTIYGLHYQLNVASTTQLTYYHYAQTGNAANPGQGPHPNRVNFLQQLNNQNHTKSVHNPDYPAFCRNISVSNGQNESNITSTSNNYTSNHLPFQANEGVTFYQLQSDEKQIRAKFNKNFTSTPFTVFFYRQNGNNGWNVVTNAKTSSNALVLDNAPGGTMFNAQNPIKNVINQFNDEVDDNPLIAKKYQYCFTPTIFTADIRNFNAATNNRRLVYSFKTNDLMFQSTNDLALDLHSDKFGYPHLAHPNDHYINYTPFDAAFTWSKNTEHVRCNELITTSTDDSYTSTPGVVYGYIRDYVVNEADIYNSYIQNRKYGFNANPNYTYRADVFSPHQIFIGTNVTQRTDFKEVKVQQNANLHCQAAESINIKPGFYARPGSVFHAEIQPYACTTTKSMVQNTPNQNSSNLKLAKSSTSETRIEAEKQTPLFLVYPNPSTGLVYLELQNPTNSPNFTYQIYNLSGKLVYNGQANTRQELTLEKGMYLIHLQQNNTSYTQKLVVY